MTTRGYDWAWTTVGVGRGNLFLGASRVAPVEGDCDRPPVYGFHDSCFATIEYGRGGYVEWYANRTGGLEQGFEIFEGIGGSGLLVIEGRVTTSLQGRVSDNLGEILFSDDHGDVLRYSGLSVSDAHGVPLDAWMEWIDPDTIRLFVDDTNAAYPITVDPGLSSAPDWTAESGQSNARFGYSVSGAGDVNADGYDDVIVGAFWYDSGQNNEGAAFVFLGSSAGVQSSPVWIAEGDQVNANLGSSVAGAGDVNADGYDDVIVGAYRYTNDQATEGRAWVYLGEDGGVQSSPAWIAEGDQSLSYFGDAVAGAGDVNNDGYDDVIVGARRYGNGQNLEGRAYVFLGQAGGVQADPVWTAESDQAVAEFGYSVAGAGDVNADGYDDVIIGARRYDNDQNNEGRAYVFLGEPGGVQAAPASIVESHQENALMGRSVAGAGDMNADGYDDVIVGAEWYTIGQNKEGAAFVFLGDPSGVQDSPSWLWVGGQPDADFGWSVAGAGDVNNDGYDDVIVGARSYSNGQTGEGGAFLFLGDSEGDLASIPASDWMAESDQEAAEFGYAVSEAGDVNGDGYDDVIIGASSYAVSQNAEGRAFVYHGQSTVTTTTTTTTSSSTTTMSSSSTTTSSSSSTTTSTAATTTTTSPSSTTTSVPATTSTTTTTDATDDDTSDDDTGTCIICRDTSECTAAFGPGWVCVENCCEEFSEDDADDDTAGATTGDDDDKDDDDDDGGCCGC
ncbi:MAG: integrin alpha [Deltaproteobacteria bacterium]|nr:integrin alpha [Deltaproteobacteria bacterium]